MPTSPVGPGEVTWRDVATTVSELEKELKGRIIWEMGTRPYAPGTLFVDMVFKRVRGRNDWYTVKYVCRLWPTSTARTMPSLLLQMAYVLDTAVQEYDDLPLFRALMEEAELPSRLGSA